MSKKASFYDKQCRVPHSTLVVVVVVVVVVMVVVVVVVVVFVVFVVVVVVVFMGFWVIRRWRVLVTWLRDRFSSPEMPWKANEMKSPAEEKVRILIRK